MMKNVCSQGREVHDTLDTTSQNCRSNQHKTQSTSASPTSLVVKEYFTLLFTPLQLLLMHCVVDCCVSSLYCISLLFASPWFKAA